MGFDVIRSFANKLRVIVEPTNSLIAMRAQKPSHFSGGVAVIYRETFCRAANNVSLRSLANSANVILGGEHFIVQGFREAVSTKRVFKPRTVATRRPRICVPVRVYDVFAANFAGVLQSIRTLRTVLMKLGRRFTYTALPARFRDAVAYGPSVLGMVREIWHRLALEPATFRSGFWCDRGDLSAATIAKMAFVHGECYNTEIV